MIDAQQTTPEKERCKTDIVKHVRMPEHQCKLCDATFESPITLFTHTLNHEDEKDTNTSYNDISNEEAVVVNNTHKTDLNPHSSPKPQADNIEWLTMDSNDSENASALNDNSTMDEDSIDNSTFQTENVSEISASGNSTVDDDSTDTTDDSTKNTENESVWDDMVSNVYNSDEYDQLVSEYRMNGNDEETANASAKRDMLDQNEHELGYSYFKLLFTYHRMKNSKIHIKTMNAVKKLQGRYTFKKALKTAIHKSRLFRRMLENDIDDEEDDDKRYFKDIAK